MKTFIKEKEKEKKLVFALCEFWMNEMFLFHCSVSRSRKCVPSSSTVSPMVTLFQKVKVFRM